MVTPNSRHGNENTIRDVQPRGSRPSTRHCRRQTRHLNANGRSTVGLPGDPWESQDGAWHVRLLSIQAGLWQQRAGDVGQSVP